VADEVTIPNFGTDGVRGRVGVELTPLVARALGQAAAEHLGGDQFVVGSDTRESGPILQAALDRGFSAVGARILDLGVVPTPAVAWVAADKNVPAAMISASHNPYYDNGIKLFAAGGLKLRDEVEARIQHRYLELARDLTANGADAVAGDSSADEGGALDLGLDRPPSPDVDGWMDSIAESVNENALAGLRVVIDCANGAAYAVAPQLLRRLGADVTVIGAEPDGTNINAGVGSTSPGALAEMVVARDADAGLAFDGDADRLIAVDQKGRIVDGDRVLALLASDWAAAGRLRDNTVVVTVMTNLGFHRAMATEGIKVISTAVGDRYVLAALDDNHLSLGGEQSGHIICRDLATTGDGILAGVQLLDVVARRGQSLADLAGGVMATVPQLLENVVLPIRNPDAAEVIADEVETVTDQFGEDGRVVVRPSGTEPLLRIMVEHIDQKTAEQACRHLVSVARSRLSADLPPSPGSAPRSESDPTP